MDWAFRCTSLSVTVLVVVILANGAALQAQSAPAGNQVPVIIGFKQAPGAAEQALVQSFGGTIKHTYRIIPSIAATVPQQALQGLRNHPWVEIVEPDAELFALDDYANVWGVTKIGAKIVHDGGNKGSGIKVCVIDSGIDKAHPDLSANYAGGYDFVNGDTDPNDDNGHGTHVAGTIAALLNGTGVVGVAPEVKILAYKILDSKGSGSFSSAIAALDACQQAGGKITNNSYGAGSDPGTQVKNAFDAAYAAGIVNVAASGNATSVFTCNSVSYPARYGSVIAVGATDSSDKIASFSCRGAEVELSAPGVSINSTYPGGGYASANGTSMASPHVAGVAALVMDPKCGIQNPADVRLRMQQTALDLGTSGRDTSFGFGRVRADLAAMNCGSPPPTVEPPNAPSNLQVTSTGRNFVNLAWSDNSANETNFELQRCTGSTCTNFATVATLPAGTTSHRDSGLRNKTTYRYRVRATNSGGASGFSNTVQATTGN